LSVSIPYFVGGRQSWEMSPPILSAGRQNRGFDKTAKTPYSTIPNKPCVQT
jgi:hypothetical protein